MTNNDILKHFSNSNKCNDSLKWFNTGIITSNRDKAKQIIENIKNSLEEDLIYKFIISDYNIELLTKNNKRYIWLNPNEQRCGLKLQSAYIDSSIDDDIFRIIILPACTYCSRDTVFIF